MYFSYTDGFNIIPKSKYIFLDDPALLSNRAIIISNLNIRFIPKKLQFIKDTMG